MAWRLDSRANAPSRPLHNADIIVAFDQSIFGGEIANRSPRQHYVVEGVRLALRLIRRVAVEQHWNIAMEEGIAAGVEGRVAVIDAAVEHCDSA